MTIDEYIQIIKTSIEEHGYDSFMPSACSWNEEKINLEVLEADLSPEGEESLAKEWALHFESNRFYLAYRAGNRQIDVCEIIDLDVKNKVKIMVKPYTAPN